MLSRPEQNQLDESISKNYSLKIRKKKQKKKERKNKEPDQQKHERNQEDRGCREKKEWRSSQ